MESFFHRRSEGRIYIKAHTKTILCELRSFGITVLPTILHFIAVQHLGAFGIVIIFLSTYLTFRLKEKMRFKIMFILNLLVSIICSCIALLVIFIKVLEWTYIVL